MKAESIFGLECLLAMVTTVAEVTREVYTFDVVPKVVQMRILLSTQGALVARSPVRRRGLLHVLVKHLSSSKMS